LAHRRDRERLSRKENGGGLAFHTQKAIAKDQQARRDGRDTNHRRSKLCDHQGFAGIVLFAINQATIGVIAISIITILDACLYDAIATARPFAGVETSIVVASVSIVALFHACLNDTVATSGDLTLICTSIVVTAVSVIALFARLEKTIATGRFDAGIEASVVVAVVSVVAFFAILDDPIATGGKRTGQRTLPLTILRALIAKLNACLNNAIATAGFLTIIETRIVVVFVSVVALFVGLDDPIATASASA
jgi:hypothetical protein